MNMIQLQYLIRKIKKNLIFFILMQVNRRYLMNGAAFCGVSGYFFKLFVNAGFHKNEKIGMGKTQFGSQERSHNRCESSTHGPEFPVENLSALHVPTEAYVTLFRAAARFQVFFPQLCEKLWALRPCHLWPVRDWPSGSVLLVSVFRVFVR